MREENESFKEAFKEKLLSKQAKYPIFFKGSKNVE